MLSPRSLVLAAAMVASLSAVPSASAATCGQSEPANEPATGALTLDADASRTELDFGDENYRDSFTFVFKVAGCTIEDASGVQARVRAPGKAQAAVGEPQISPKETLLVIDIPVTSERFRTGKHSATLTLSGPAIAESVVKLSMQRKEPQPLPLLIAGLALLAGFAAAVWAHALSIGAADGKKVEVKIPFVAAAFVPAAAAGLVVLKTSYYDPVLFDLDVLNGATLALGVASAAAGGTGAAALAKGLVAKARRKRRR